MTLRYKSSHKIMCGDSTDKDDVEKLMQGEKADMVFTDPPYGMNLNVNYGEEWGKKSDLNGSIGRKNSPIHKPVIGDDKEYNPNHIFDAFHYCKEIFLWGADYYCHHIPYGGWLVWDKTGGHESLENVGFSGNFELCWSKQSHKRDIMRYTYKGVSGMKKDDGKRVHPTQKPVGLCEKFITQWSKETVVDLFLGSGSTLIACEKTDRKCRALEIDPHYCSVVIQRYIDYVGSDKEVYLIDGEKRTHISEVPKLRD